MWWSWGDNFLNRLSFSPCHGHYFPPPKSMLLWPPDDQLQTELTIPGAPYLPAFLTVPFTSAKREEEPYLPTQRAIKKKRKKKETRKWNKHSCRKAATSALEACRGALGVFGVACRGSVPRAPPFRSPHPSVPFPAPGSPERGGRSWLGREGRAPLPSGSHDMSCRSCTEAHVTELIVGFPPLLPQPLFFFFWQLSSYLPNRCY